MKGIEKKLSEEFNLPQDQIHEVVSFSYQYLQSILRNEYTTYEISELGTLQFEPKAARKKLQELRYGEKYREQKDKLIEVINGKLNLEKKKENS